MITFTLGLPSSRGMPLPSHEAQHSLSLVVRFDQSLLSSSGSTSVVTIMMIRSACISDILLPRNVLVTFFLLIKYQSRSPSGIQPNQANTQQHCLALSPLSAALTLLLVAACFNPRLFDLAASTSIDADELLPRSLRTMVLLDPVPQTLWSRGGGGDQLKTLF